MILERYLVKEIFQTFIAVMLVLTLIVIGRYLALYLAWAAEGFISGAIVMRMLLLRLVGVLNIILPVGYFISVLLAFGRLYKDNEMTAFAAAAISQARIVRIVFVLSTAVAVLVAGITMYLSPWADARQYRLQERAKTEAEIDSVMAGHFNQISSKDDAVFYTERLSDDRKSMQQIFVQSYQDGLIDIFSARTGHQYIDRETGDRYLVLVDGYRYQGWPGDANFSIQHYKKTAIRIEKRVIKEQNYSTATLPTSELWGSKKLEHQAELQWRLAMPLSVLLLSVLAVFLSRTSARQGRYAKLLIGVLVYILYNNTMSISRSWIEQGSISPSIGIWWVHGLMIILLLVLFVGYSGWQWTRDNLLGRVNSRQRPRQIVQDDNR